MSNQNEISYILQQVYEASKPMHLKEAQQFLELLQSAVALSYIDNAREAMKPKPKAKPKLKVIKDD